METFKSIIEFFFFCGYYETKFTIFMDKLTGVTEYQKIQRRGLLRHEVVPYVQQRDWVDRIEDLFDARFKTLINMNPCNRR